jgi:hypothetical protein
LGPERRRNEGEQEGVDVYKVGHHGSLNATPKKLLWNAFTKRGKSKKLKTVLSTMPGKHGKVANKTEVPRKPLMDALNGESTLSNTHDLPVSKTKLQLNTIVTVEP